VVQSAERLRQVAHADDDRLRVLLRVLRRLDRVEILRRDRHVVLRERHPALVLAGRVEVGRRRVRCRLRDQRRVLVQMLLVVLLRQPGAAPAATGEEDDCGEQTEGEAHSPTVAVR